MVNITEGYKGEVVARLQGEFDKKEGAFGLMLDYLKIVIKYEIWKEYPMHNHPLKVFKFKSFNDFITEKRSVGGLETDKGKLLKICEDDKELSSQILDLVNPVLNRHGGDRKNEKTKDIQPVNNRLNYDNGKSYAIKRLKRDNPELAKQVINGELSANAAAIKAGFRKKTMTITADKEGIIKAIIKLGLGEYFNI